MNPVLDADLVRHALARVRQSREYRRSPGLQSFLAFLVESRLVQDEGALKESVIGVEVFHRAPGYDTKADPIVRVHEERALGVLRGRTGKLAEHEHPLLVEARRAVLLRDQVHAVFERECFSDPNPVPSRIAHAASQT